MIEILVLKDNHKANVSLFSSCNACELFGIRILSKMILFDTIAKNTEAIYGYNKKDDSWALPEWLPWLVGGPLTTVYIIKNRKQK